jgi:hypothetical protein
MLVFDQVRTCRSFLMPNQVSPWLAHLELLGKTEGFLTYLQISEALPPEMVDPEEIENVVDQLKQAGIRVVEATTDSLRPRFT